MTEIYSKITTHEDDAKDRQVWQYEDADNFNSLIEIHANRMQLIENALWDLLRLRAISTATGTQLDRVGEYYQVLRSGDTDTVYRSRIISEINRVQKAGQVEIMLSSLRSLSGQDDVTLIQVFPCALLMHILVDDISDVTNQDTILNTMDGVKAAGVSLDIGLQVSNPFVFSNSPLGGATGTGFSTVADGTGGGVFSPLLS